MSLLSSLLRRRAAPAPVPIHLSLTDGPVYAVGDTHGCRDLLRGLEALIRADAAAFAGRPRVVLLGDMVDRGPDTAGLIDDLLRPLPWGSRMAMRGNHEAMMLAFLSDPAGHADWLDQGGYATLMSYGLALNPAAPLTMARKRLDQTLTAHLPDAHLAWLRALPWFCVVAGAGADGAGVQHWVLAHAGYDPDLGPARQRPDTLIWGGARPRPGDATGLVHGHVIQSAPDATTNCIGIDTGAYKTGHLTALRLVQHHAPSLLSYSDH